MDRTELTRRLAESDAEIGTTLDTLRQQMDSHARLADGWTLEALATEHVDRLKVLAGEYKVEVTDDVIRGVWLASQLILDLDTDMMLADN